MDNPEQLLIFISKWSFHNAILCGDIISQFHINCHEKKSMKDFLNVLCQFNFYCHNNTPTRGDLCLDNAFSNKKIYTEVEHFTFSDHLIEAEAAIHTGRCNCETSC